ncbi:hypothetical protein CPB97_000903 [Podila verticillata]|nr:hypothetical protein CPB97_000903 [Podila verticillata]
MTVGLGSGPWTLLVSCSFFVPVPAIVVKSQRQLESILPYLPLPSLPLSLSTSLASSSTSLAKKERSSGTLCSASSLTLIPAYNRKPSLKLHQKSRSLRNSYLSATYLAAPSSNDLQQNHNHSRDYHSNYCYGYNNNNDSYYNPNYDASMSPRDTPVLFTFPYPPYGHHFPTSVQVTGNFDEWQRTCYLHKNDVLNRFETDVQIDLERLTLVKDHEDQDMKRKERDYEGNLNNIRFLRDVTEEEEKEAHQEEKQRNEVHLKKDEISGDVKPSQDGSVVPPNDHHSVVNGDEHDGDGDYGVVLLQGEPVTVPSRNKNGDAQLSIDASAMPTSTSSDSLETVITTATTTTALAPSLSSSRPITIHISTAPSSMTSSATSSPTTSGHNINNKANSPSHHNLFSKRNSMIVMPSAPTTAISTSAPALPSTNTPSNVSSKTEKRKTGFWRKLKKVLS